MKLTAAGTVQESHLFPSHNSTELLTENAAKIVLFSFDSTLQLIFFSNKIKFTEKSKHCSEVIIFFVFSPPLTERWPSGRRRTPGKCVGAESVSRVRIPLSPQKSVNQEVARFTLFFFTHTKTLHWQKAITTLGVVVFLRVFCQIFLFYERFSQK